MCHDNVLLLCFRFDRTLKIEPPSTQQRQALLEQFLSQLFRSADKAQLSWSDLPTEQQASRKLNSQAFLSETKSTVTNKLIQEEKSTAIEQNITTMATLASVLSTMTAGYVAR